MPMARPTRWASCPSGRSRAYSANTGRIRNRPSMRSAKMLASERLARNSLFVMRSRAGAVGAAGSARLAGWGEEGIDGIALVNGILARSMRSTRRMADCLAPVGMPDVRRATPETEVRYISRFASPRFPGHAAAERPPGGSVGTALQALCKAL